LFDKPSLNVFNSEICFTEFRIDYKLWFLFFWPVVAIYYNAFEKLQPQAYKCNNTAVMRFIE